jgi:dTDP-4-amino-4,6-dideoxygalactose transaminase
MQKIKQIADKHNLLIIEDACHAINAERDNFKAGFYGDTACFSMHPLKNLNVWGDGGIVVTNSKKMFSKISLLRNHGLRNRDVCEIFAYNSRLDTLQAIVGLHLFKKIDAITEKRIENAKYFDDKLSSIPQVNIPIRLKSAKQVYHIYVIKVKDRDKLQSFLIDKNIDAKVHYPIPMHLQPASKFLNYKEGDFPKAEDTCKNVLSLPVHEFISKSECDYVINSIKEFYKC